MGEQQAAEEPDHSPLSLPHDETLITGKQLRELIGRCSDMHIWRMLNDQKYRALAFPKPIKINDRNYWRLGAVRQWIRAQEAQSQRVLPDNSGGALAPDGEALQQRARQVARGGPHVAHPGDAGAHVALPAGIAGIGASRNQNRPSKRAGRNRVRES